MDKRLTYVENWCVHYIDCGNKQSFFSLLDDQEESMVRPSAERKKERKKRKKSGSHQSYWYSHKNAYCLSLSYVPLSNGAVTNEYFSSTIWVRHNRKHYYLFILQKLLIKIRVQLLVFQIYLMMLLCRLQILQYNYHWNLQSIII
jgi:hypothetical protein